MQRKKEAKAISSREDFLEECGVLLVKICNLRTGFYPPGVAEMRSCLMAKRGPRGSCTHPVLDKAKPLGKLLKNTDFESWTVTRW